MMYKLKYSRLAKKDMENIIFYIGNKFKNKIAVYNLKEEFIKQQQNILTFPYGSSIYKAPKSLEFEYRIATVKNFNIFYIINEDIKTIIIVRVLYKKRNAHKLLK